MAAICTRKNNKLLLFTTKQTQNNDLVVYHTVFIYAWQSDVARTYFRHCIVSRIQDGHLLCKVKTRNLYNFRQNRSRFTISVFADLEYNQWYLRCTRIYQFCKNWNFSPTCHRPSHASIPWRWWSIVYPVLGILMYGPTHVLSYTYLHLSRSVTDN